MPFFQAMASRANAALSKEQLAGVDPAVFAEGQSLVDALRAVGVVQSDDEAAYLGAFPSGLQEAVRSLLHDNLVAQGGPLDVTVAWSPGYDDEVALYQVANSGRSQGGITILVKSRYPDDRSAPGTGINA